MFAILCSMNSIKIGCEAYIIRDNKLLLGKRGKDAYGSGTWALPGGHLEFFERADECIIRELHEEMGLVATPRDVTLLGFTDDINKQTGRHYVHLTFKVDIGNQEIKLLERTMCSEWKWFPLDKLPEDIFPAHHGVFKTINSGKRYLAQE